MHMATKMRWSRADLERLPDDGNRYEVLDGQLFVTPSPLFPHQWIATRLTYFLTPYVDQHRLGSVVGPGVVVVGKNELLPDVAVIPIGPLGAPEKWDQLPQAILVTEVLSRTTRRRDLVDKRAAYQRWRIPIYWVIDRFERRALVWTPESETEATITDQLVWQPRADIDPLVIRLDDILIPVA